MSEKITWKDYYASASTAPQLSPRERAFIGLAVTLTKSCEP